MTTPTSSLKFSDIQTEFGGSNPIAISEFYGVNANVPASGAIALSKFLGISNYAASHPAVNLLDSQISPTNASVYHEVNSDGTYDGQEAGVTQSSGTWKTGGGTGANYDVQLIHTSGNVPSGSAVNTWLNLATTRSWSLLETTDGSYASKALSGYLVIRVAGGGSELSNSAVLMQAEVDV